jgi:hypothetical protein
MLRLKSNPITSPAPGAFDTPNVRILTPTETSIVLTSLQKLNDHTAPPEPEILMPNDDTVNESNLAGDTPCTDAPPKDNSCCILL